MRRLTPALIALSLALGACEHPTSNVKVEVPEEETKGNVSLPPAPAPGEFVIKEKNDDDTLRVLGLIEYKEKHLEQLVTVTGHISSISPKCDPAEAKKNGSKCDEPNMTIMDDPEEDARMMVVGFSHELLEDRKIAAGEVHQLTGTYKTMALGFTDTESGVLLLQAIDGDSIVDPPTKKKKKRR